MQPPSKQGSTIIPSVRYKDAHKAIDWLCTVFGFERQAVYDGPNGTVAHAQLVRGGGMLMLGSESNWSRANERMIGLDQTGGRETVALCLIAPDVDAVYARVVEAGAEIVDPLIEPEYGGKAFACRDLEGHIWWVGSYDPWAGSATTE